MRRAIVTVALFGAAATPSMAGEELLTRAAMNFNECPAAISAMLESLGANQIHTQTISDTGAHYYVELESTSANLQFRCNAVTEQIEIARITPGTLKKPAAE